jgi:16S rRNA (uracil1498-N3)-methyltransferase
VIRLPIARERIAARVELERAERHYLLGVLRLSPGASLEVFDGEGGRYRARLCEDGALALGPREASPAPRSAIALAPALVKGEKMELVIQKATELGAFAVAPWESERSVVRLAGARARERVERWQKIAQAAARQCGRADVPRVHDIASLDDVLALGRSLGAQAIVLWEQERNLRLSQAAAEAPPGALFLLVGPEGGFTEGEIARARASGARTATLGERVLRAETAPLAALSVLLFLAGELG